MNAYINKSKAIIDLHERGFTEDFELFGNDLLWIQEKIFFRPKQFSIMEAHRFLSSSGKELVIFAIRANGGFPRGILIYHFKDYTDKLPPAINQKMIQMDSNYLSQQYNYAEVRFSR
jgi:hypothetical protein